MLSKEILVTLNDNKAYRLHYTDWGDSDRVLVCVHGLTRNCRDFDYLAKELSENHGFRVISIDMPGRGKSQYLPDSKMYNYANYYLATLSLLSQLKLTSIDYLGSSMGGILAMYIAQDYPNLFNKLILNDVGTFLPKESLARISRYVRVYPSFTDLEHAKAHIKVKLAYFGIKTEENWNYITKHSTHINNNGVLVLDYDFGVTDGMLAFEEKSAQDMDLSNLWAKVNAKEILLLRGEKSDVFSSKTALSMMKDKANSQLIEFKNTGHAPALMEEEQLSQVIKWLV
jgi:pimeloyl-ACP methyl ester carboxylesterase